MCHFITATVPHNADLKQVRAVIATHKHGFQQLANPHLQPQLPPDDQYLGLTRKMCDCGTVLGCLSQSEGKAVPEAREREKLRRKGWSPARIERWVAERERAGEKRARDRGQAQEQRMAEAQGWIDFLRALLSTKGVAHVGLLLHWYRSAPEDERFAIQWTEKIRVDEATAEGLMRIEEDVLYLFVP
jgi:hypothetical protein